MNRTVILVLLALTVTAFGSVSFPGIIYTGSKTVAADSARFAISGGLRTFPTSGWGGGSERYDTTWFTLDEKPTYFGLYYKMNGEPQDPLLAVFTQDSWYYLPVTGNPPPRFPQLKWGTDAGVQEPAAGAVIEQPLRVAPNPFAHLTSLTVALGRAAAVELEICDAAGRTVRVLASGAHAPGSHRWTWDGSDEAGRRLAAGIYFARLAAEETRSVRKLILND